jgi:hypothetical protein
LTVAGLPSASNSGFPFASVNPALFHTQKEQNMKNRHSNLSEFNRLFADALLPAFPANVQAIQSEDGTLLFCGSIPLADDQTHVGTHVGVSLDKEVQAALGEAEPADREEMIKILINNLGTQVRCQYDSSKIGLHALDIVGKMNILRG